ncbi:MAG: CCDC90 family protein [Rhodoferax sp.]|nr:CCDC90 family protein [Rhodoferax sp.]MCF8209119.1 CCDC90 family protein [Rhodoferax sp.]
MSTITFDTLEATRKLRDAGFDEKQAETVVRVLSDAQSNLVTKADLGLELTPVRADISLMKWMLGAVLALAIANFAKQYF